MDKQVSWILAGIAARLGETTGVGKERNLQSLALFGAEMRRTLWSQTHLLNGCPVRRGGDGDSAKQISVEL